MSLTPNAFSIIVSEICTKQNGINLNAGDDRKLEEVFVRMGGNLEKLEGGILSEFDLLKSVIISAYEGGMIASDPFGTRISVKRGFVFDSEKVVSQFELGRKFALNFAEEVLGRRLLAALLNIKVKG